MASFKDLTIAEYTDALSSKAPVPGGGGTAALAAALGCALGQMVGSLTVGKKKYSGVEAEIAELNRESEALTARLLSTIDKDAEAFAPLACTYQMPHETEEEKEKRQTAMEDCLLAAAEAPLEVLKLCERAAVLAETYAEKGSSLAISDAGCAAALIGAAAKAAALNVRINTGAMKDQARASELNHQTEQLLGTAVTLTERTYATVSKKLGGEA